MKVKKIWDIDELRNKVLFTAMILIIYRIGCAITVPFINPVMIEAMFSGGNFFNYLDMLSGGALQTCALFALGVSPHINASIVMQLLIVAIPALERIKEEDVDNKKIKKITQYVAVAFGLVMSVGYYAMLRSYGALKYGTGLAGAFEATVIISALLAGTQAVAWLGYKIDEKGIGNGISIIIFIGIISGWDNIKYSVDAFFGLIKANNWLLVAFICSLPILLVASIFFVIKATNAEKRISVQYARSVSGGHSVGGQSTYIPIKLIMSGVMPIIFASTLMSLPQTIAMFVNPETSPTLFSLLTGLNTSNWLYILIYVILIFGFNYFYIEVQFDAQRIANNLRKKGGCIPGVRPGKYTKEYLTKSAHSVAVCGSLILSAVAASPIFFGNITGLAIQLGGTSLLIVVGVVLESVNEVDSFMVSRHHKGFL